MKILCTGMNKMQCTKDFFLRQQLRVVPSHYSVIRCLEDMGHEVEQREVVPGEDLSSYDEMIFYIHSPQSFCQNLYTGLYALSQHKNAIIAFDDWQIDQIYNGIEGFKKNLYEEGDKAYREYLISLQNTQYEISELKKYHTNYQEAVEIILNKSNRLLVSAFAHGDLSLLKLGWNTEKMFRFNPNPYHLNRTPENNFGSNTFDMFGADVDPEEKVKEWNFASLVQNKTKKWLNAQEVNWPINFYGSRRGEHKCERLTEDEMCRVFAQQWGCLMPGYHHKGSGWWRARPLQVADAGSILIGDKEELMVYYGDEDLCTLKASEIESMDLSQLIQIARAQKEALYDRHSLNKYFEQDELSAILESK